MDARHTFIDLQNQLVDEITEILSQVTTTDPDGNSVTGIKGYRHSLPMDVQYDGDEEKVFPFFIVRLAEIKTDGDDDCWHAKTIIELGVHEADYRGGSDHILVMTQRIADRFAAQPRMGNFRAEQGIECVFDEGDTYPYNYGALTVTFSVPKIDREDGYYD